MRRADGAVERAVRSFAAEMIGLAAHDLSNRLATMRETVGLLEDLARAGKSAAAGTARAQASLDDQVGRALNIVRALGGLAGALGSDGGFDAGDALEALLGLTDRRAKQRSLRIEREAAAGLPRAAGDPALFLCLVNRLLERWAASVPSGGSLGVRVARAGDRIGVRLVPAATPGRGAADTDDELLRELALRLGAGLEFMDGGGATLLLAALH